MRQLQKSQQTRSVENCVGHWYPHCSVSYQLAGTEIQGSPRWLTLTSARNMEFDFNWSLKGRWQALFATTMTSTRFTRFSRQGHCSALLLFICTFIFSEQQNCIFVLGLVGCLERLQGGGAQGVYRHGRFFRPIWESFTWHFPSA